MNSPISSIRRQVSSVVDVVRTEYRMAKALKASGLSVQKAFREAGYDFEAQSVKDAFEMHHAVSEDYARFSKVARISNRVASQALYLVDTLVA